MSLYSIEYLIEHVQKSIESADKSESKLSSDILELPGMSGIKTRHLYNNLANLDSANYLEVGTFMGSTFISSIYRNPVKSIAIDNWSEFGYNKEIFLQNVNRYCEGADYCYIEKDCFQISHDDIKCKFDTIDIYMYDGCHSYECQKQAITHFSPFLSRHSIVIVDDWRDQEWNQVIIGTYDGFKECPNLVIHKQFERKSKHEVDGKYEYWNGFGIFIVENISQDY
jgi:hypothetical protein